MKNLNEIQELQLFENLELIAKQVVEGFITGLHKSPFHGFSVEFAEHRLYNTGESTRHIDWKLFARTDKMFVKKFEEETNLRTQLVIDTSSSMFFPYTERNLQSKLAFSVLCSAALVYLFRKQRDAVGLSLFNETLHLHSQAKLSGVHVKWMFNELEKLLNITDDQLKHKTSAARVLHEIADKMHKRSLVIIFSDMMDFSNQQALFSAMQHLRHNKHEVILFHVQDKKHEEEFVYNNRPYKFVDMESGEAVRIIPGDIRSQYIDMMKDFKSQIKMKCGQYNIDFIECDTASNFKEILLPYLIKRSKLI